VVVIQALAFADGGLTALGVNVLNMAVVTAIGGWAVFVLLRRVMPATVNGLSLAAGLAAAASVVMSSMAFSIQWLFGATAPVSFAKVFGAMVTVHLLIGIGEGLITALAVRSVLAVRPDLVKGAEGLDLQVSGRTRSLRAVTIGGIAVAFVIATVVAQFAVGDPDGLERVATDTGFADSGRDSSLAGSIFSDYATEGLENEALSLAIAGATGTVITLAVGWGLFAIVRDRRRPARSPA